MCDYVGVSWLAVSSASPDATTSLPSTLARSVGVLSARWTASRWKTFSSCLVDCGGDGIIVGFFPATQKHNADCTEAFYHQQVTAAMKAKPVVDDATKKKTEQSVRKYMEKVMFGDPCGSDSSEDDPESLPDDVLSLFQRIAFSDGEIPLEALPEDIRRQFERAAADGSLSAALPGS
jgi:hypothetical protein